MNKVECIKISNQRSDFYINAKGVTSNELLSLWVSLSKKGYYKISGDSYYVDSASAFPDLISFRKNRGI